MAFTYQLGANPVVDYIRLLISDTQQEGHIFEDEEITSAFSIQALQFQSGQFYSGPAGANLPSTPVSYLRVAALLLDSIASNRSRLSGITQLLDVKMDVSKAAQELRATARSYRETDDNAGAFAVIEQCSDQWSFRQRFWNEVQRQQGGGV